MLYEKIPKNTSLINVQKERCKSLACEIIAFDINEDVLKGKQIELASVFSEINRTSLLRVRICWYLSIVLMIIYD